MIVTDIFRIKGRGTVAAGLFEVGHSVGAIVRCDNRRWCICGIERRNRMPLPGEPTGLLLEPLGHSSEPAIGDILALEVDERSGHRFGP